MDKKKTLGRSLRDACIGIAVFGVAVPLVDALVTESAAIEEAIPGWAGAGLGAFLLVLWRFLRDWWKHGGGRTALIGKFDEYGPLVLVLVTAPLIALGCTTMQSETVNADGTYYKHSFVQAPLSKTDMTDMVYRSEVAPDGSWTQHIGSTAEGMDSTSQLEALDPLYQALALGAAMALRPPAPEPPSKPPDTGTGAE